MAFEKYVKSGRAFRTVAYNGLHIGKNIVNITGKLFKKMEVIDDRVDIYYDKKSKTIALEVVSNGAYKLGQTMGCQISEVMPIGRYYLTDQKENTFYLTPTN